MRTMRRTAAALLCIVAVGLTVTTSAAAADRAAPGAEGSPTVVASVSPVDDTGALKPRYDVTHRYGGARCQRGSALTGTAYRCFTSRSPQGVYDPCWVATTSDHVICLDVPWRRHKVTQLRVSDGYDDAGGFRRQPRPWGLRPALAHRRCLLHPTAVEYAQGQPVHYYCSRRTVLAGPLDRSGARWRMHAYRNLTPHGQSAERRPGQTERGPADSGRQGRTSPAICLGTGTTST